MTTPHASLDKNLMATMTDEEREAINGADPDEIASLAAVGAEKDPVHVDRADSKDADEDEDDEGDEPGAESEPEPEAKADVAPTEAAAAEEQAPAAIAASPEPEPAQVAYRYELPQDFEARRAAVRTANDEALGKFEAGDFTREELLAEQERIAEERRTLDAMQTRAELAADMQRQTSEAVRMAAVNRMFAEAAKPEAGGVDYRKDEAKMRDLDTFVKALAADDANADKPLGWFLDEAHRRVKVLHNIAPAAPAPAVPKTPAEIKAAAAAARKPDLSGSTPDLSQVPGGSDSSDVGGEFADIDSLEGQAFEDAIRRMAKSQPERFARYSSGAQ